STASAWGPSARSCSRPSARTSLGLGARRARFRAGLKPGKREQRGRDDERRDPMLGVVMAGLGGRRRAVTREERGQGVLRLYEVDDRDHDQGYAEDHGRERQLPKIGVHGPEM